MPEFIDLRSDTVTRPTPAMRRAMAEAEVGDDVFGDDPTVRALEERAAELTGKDAGLFVASGTMGNLVSHMAHVARGGEIVASVGAHVVEHEGAAMPSSPERRCAGCRPGPMAACRSMPSVLHATTRTTCTNP
jgi:threonine aldolase